MNGWTFWVAVGTLLCLVVGLAFGMRRWRTAALRKAAEALGFQFVAEGDASLVDRVAGFELDPSPDVFGGAKRVRNLLRRHVEGTDVAIFDYSVRRRSSNSYLTTTVLLLEAAELDLPQFVARPESVFQKLGSVLGGHDIDFPEHPLFSRKFVLKGENEQAIRRVMTDEVLRAFEEHTGLGISGFSFEGRGRQLIVYPLYRTVGARGLRGLLDAGTDIAAPLIHACRQGLNRMA